MRPAEIDALVEQGLDALKAAKGLSEHEQDYVNKIIAKIEAAASVEAPAEEPVATPDLEPEPKAEAKKPRRILPTGGGGKKGKK